MTAAPSEMASVGVIGGGAWGTALAIAAARAGRRVVLWARDPAVVRAIAGERRNPDYLPGIEIDRAVVATAEVEPALACDAVLLVTPAQHLRAVCGPLAPLWRPGIPAVIAAKGIERGSFLLMSGVVAAALPPGTPLAVLSGPTFAAEVARGLPTAVTLACADAALGRRLVAALGSATFRPYLTDDLTGVEIGGAVKNVLAIACGIAMGCRLGDNARAALITRGLAEIGRLALALGARAETLMGLSGLGDLTLTCSGTQSRNLSLGIALGEGRPLAELLGNRRSVAEGVDTAAAVAGLAARHGVEMPICAAVDAVLAGRAEVGATIRALLARPFRAEPD